MCNISRDPIMLTGLYLLTLLWLAQGERASLWPLEEELPFLGNYRKKRNVTDAEVDDSCVVERFNAFLSEMVKAIRNEDPKRVGSIRDAIDAAAQEDSKFAKSICYTSGAGSPVLECRKTSPQYLDYSNSGKAESGSSGQCKCWNSLNFRTIFNEQSNKCRAARGSPCNDAIRECHLSDDKCVGVQDLKTGEYCMCQSDLSFKASIVKPKLCSKGSVSGRMASGASTLASASGTFFLHLLCTFHYSLDFIT